MMKEPYKYYAFISFQHKDAKYALWLQRQIENYLIPIEIRRQNKDIPKNIKPLFCYLNDIHHSEELMQELQLRMEQSQYLIVLCSPNAAQSKYINAGIEYFISLGRRDKIIPVIISGEPYSQNKDSECFPKALRDNFPSDPNPLQDHSILGINLREQGVNRLRSEKRALLMIVARILGIQYTGLATRERKKRQRIRLLVGLILTLLLLIIGTVWYSAQVKNIKIDITEATTPNLDLPQLNCATLTLSLPNETKTDTLSFPDGTFEFRNLPPHMLGKPVNAKFRADYYLPLDTEIVLTEHLELPVKRDTNLFGLIDIGIVGKLPDEPLQIYIEDTKVEINDENRIRAYIPQEMQHTKYHIYSIPDYINDTIYMPTGPYDIIVIPSKK